MNYFIQLRGSDFTDQEKGEISNIIKQHEFPIPFNAMPIDEGIAYVSARGPEGPMDTKKT